MLGDGDPTNVFAEIKPSNETTLSLATWNA